MSEKEKLRKRFEEQGEDGGLIADKLAAAMAEGKIDEFMKQELPDNEYARKLAQMMMGISGMMPQKVSDFLGTPVSGEQAPAQPPEDSMKSVVDDLSAIAGDNGLTLDWLILRALKLYTQEYKRTGKL